MTPAAGAPAVLSGPMTDVERVAVLVPGRGYTVERALFNFVEMALRRRHAEVHGIRWQVAEAGTHTELTPWVCDEVATALEPLPAAAPLVVGKSLGSLAAPLAADRGLPAIWLTPLLHHDVVVEGLSRASAPMLLVGGTADSSWDGPAARQLSPYVCEIPDADHGLWVPGPLADSARALGEMGTAVERFLDEVVWPAG